ncbi:MAG TPA: gephyrin-like molybdotransferase Glp [Rhizobiaceae bacterium]|nr:gephyrin-like molybdotransferase Glp [Rhizobiaceae bacterium]
MTLLPVAEALARVTEGAKPGPAESVPLHEAAGRVLAAPLRALRTQPPFDASAMDGYAVRATDVAASSARLRVVGEAPAGKLFPGKVQPGEAVRIFTGAPVPEGADTILIQENARKLDGGAIETTVPVSPGKHIRRRGLDFVEGEELLEAGRLLDPAALSLAASANHPALNVIKRPRIAIIATGDELLPPGSKTGPDQIISSNAYGVAAVAKSVGAEAIDLGIAPDHRDAIASRVRQALDASVDVIVTLGGASVGDHDLVHDVLADEGMALDFWKIAMRPGKPLMFGRLGSTRILGLPGNPVASLVCSHLFLKPLLARLGGLPHEPDMRDAVLGATMPANDQRQDYVRATTRDSDGRLVATPFHIQDSSMLRTLADSNALIVREPGAPAADAGAHCRVLFLR